MSRKEREKELEIGVTYHKNGKYFIAVTEKLLATYEHGNFTTRKPYSSYIADRQLPVESLCDVWKISTQKLDELSRKYFTPANCRDQRPSERTARKNEMFREPPIRIVKYQQQSG